ncbi:MAG TPA: hypothetical protein VLB80_03690 [Candidatus Babeliales bacterium]|nr:hypothetical protein [Candidatus Babeliales bacterium]
MFFIIMIVLFLFSVAIPIFSSQIADNSINISVQLNEPINLMYMLRDEDNLKKFNIKASNNIPYLRVCYRNCSFKDVNLFDACDRLLQESNDLTCNEIYKKELNRLKNQDNIATIKDITNVYNDLRDNLLRIPFNYFLKYDEDDKYFVCQKNIKFKNKDEVLFSFKKIINSTERIFNIIFGNDLSNDSPQTAINSFYENPKSIVDQEEQLIELGILAKNNYGKIIHGQNGYFHTKPIQIKINITNTHGIVNSLFYINEELITNYKKLKIDIQCNEPCFTIDYGLTIEKSTENQTILPEILNSIRDHLNKIAGIPLRFLIKSKDNIKIDFTPENIDCFEFKAKNETVIELVVPYANKEIRCEVRISNWKNLVNRSLIEYVDMFRKKPNYFINCNNLNALIKEEIISSDGNKHGENSFFGTEIKKERRRAELTLFYSRLKKLSLCGLCGLIAFIVFFKNSINWSAIVRW